MGAMLDEDLEGLSAEERAALMGDEGDDAQDRDLLRSLLHDDDGDDEDDQDDEADPGDATRAAAAAAAAQGQDGGAAGQGEAGPAAAGPEATAPVPTEFQPVYTAAPVEDFAGKMAQIAQAQRELATGYENGDFDLAEYQARLRQVTEHEWALREQQLKANLAAEQRQQQMAQRWQWEQERFFSQAVNKAYREDPVIGPAFAAAVQMLAADNRNDQRSMAWFLEEADRLTRARFRVGGEETTTNRGGVNGQGANGQGANGQGRRRGAPVPPSLGGLPAASLPETGADEFSRLDRLEGLDLERALAKLTEAEVDRYLLARSV